eukprot:14596739-Heterocapsa_arctica.AAC.1
MKLPNRVSTPTRSNHADIRSPSLTGGLPSSAKANHSSREELIADDQVSENQNRGWRAVYRAELKGAGG